MFTRVGTVACEDLVGPTTNGGVSFGPLRAVVGWNCNEGFGPRAVSLDTRGDAFLYGPKLEVTHTGGRTWVNSPQAGPVLAIDVIASSVWMVEADCSRYATTPVCPLSLRVSSNGGRSWSTVATPPDATAPRRYAAAAPGQTFLVRVTTSRAILVAAPEPGGRTPSDGTSFWVTADGGKSWSERTLSCGLPRGMNVMSIAMAAGAGESLFAVCATQASAGYEAKTALRSTNEGRSWTLTANCATESPARCASAELDAGYLGALVATSTNTEFVSGDRTSLLMSRDGGTRWRVVVPEIGNTGSASQSPIFFGARRGIVLEPFAYFGNPSTLWTTSDGGLRWTPVVPTVR